MLLQAFKTAIFPYVIEIGGILFILAVASSTYSMIRTPNGQQFVEKLKGAVVAYAFLRGAFVILDFINRIIDNIKI